MRNSSGKPVGTYTGRANKIGGGGWTHHLVQSSNGDWLFCTHDTLGASKRYRTDTEWTPLITNDTLPAGFFGTGAPATSDGQVSNKADNARGCWGIEVAKSDDTRLYAGLDGWVIRSDNRGGTWTKTTLAAKTMQANLNEFRNWNNKIAVHPTDKNIVVVGSMEGSNYSTDGGTTWNAISVAAGSILNTYYQSPHTFVFKQDGSKVYCMRYGTGIYEATTLAGPWTLLNATNYPTSATHMATDATGNLWACDPAGTAGSNIRKWNGTTWTIYTVGGSELFHTIAIDPANNNRITVAGQYGNLATSTDGGATWAQKVTGQINTSYTDYWNIQLSCVPGQSGHCYYTSGRDFTGPFTRTTDGWTSKSTVPNVDSVVCFGFGKSAPGQTYPAIYFVGRVSGVNGYYVTYDNFATAPIFIGTWPGNWVDIPTRIAGDWQKFGRFYVGMAGSSVRICDYQNKLLIN